jgi:PEP-CTERM motif
MNILTKTMIGVGLLLGSGVCAIADTIWTLNDATFQYNSTGNTATGTFELDPSLNLITWDITVAGTNTQADNVFTPGDSISVFPDLTHLDFWDGATGQYIDLFFSSPLTTAGGTINLAAGDDGESSSSTITCPGCAVLVVNSDHRPSVTGVASTPEPATIPFLGAGLVLIGIVTRRKLVRAN